MLYETSEEIRDHFERSVVGMVVTYSKRESDAARDTRVRIVRAMLADEDVEAARVHDVNGRKIDGQVRVEIDPMTEPEPAWWESWWRRLWRRRRP